MFYLLRGSFLNQLDSVHETKIVGPRLRPLMVERRSPKVDDEIDVPLRSVVYESGAERALPYRLGF
jgi:hypothetical protein